MSSSKRAQSKAKYRQQQRQNQRRYFKVEVLLDTDEALTIDVPNSNAGALFAGEAESMAMTHALMCGHKPVSAKTIRQDGD